VRELESRLAPLPELRNLLWPLLALSVPQEPAFPAISPLSPFSQPEQQRL
jgi:hypothetical protein